MPRLSANEVWSARIDRVGLRIFGLLMAAIVFVFYVGDILMSFRLFGVGALAIWDRFWRGRKERKPRASSSLPPLPC